MLLFKKKLSQKPSIVRWVPHGLLLERLLFLFYVYDFTVYANWFFLQMTKHCLGLLEMKI